MLKLRCLAPRESVSKLMSFPKQLCVRSLSTSGGNGGDSGDEWWSEEGSRKKGEETTGLFDTGEDQDEEAAPSPIKKQEIFRRSSIFTNISPRRRMPVVAGTPKLSISQALFLAKEAGIYTTREVQTHMIKSPSFSKDKNAPFLLENFFTSADQSDQIYTAEFSRPSVRTPIGEPVLNPSQKTMEKTESLPPVYPLDVVPSSVHEFLLKGSKRPVASFGARGREWLERSEGKGTRKRSVAHVILERGSGIVKVNGEEDLYKRWPLLSNRFDVLFPFEISGSAGLFDVNIKVRGGGISGQAGAARLAIGRALVAACAQVESDFRDTLILHEDT